MDVERLSASDAAFLYMENRVVHMHVTGVLVLDPSTVPGGFTFDGFRTHVLNRLQQIPVFHQRLLRSPFGLDHPVWADDPDFNPTDHMRQVDLGGTATTSDLQAWVGEFATARLDYSKPLWEMVVVEGFADGSVALVTKIHHVAVDGASGTDIMAQIVDLEALPPDTEELALDAPTRLPNQAQLFVGAVASRATSPLRGVRAFGRSLSSIGNVVREVTARGDDRHSMARPFDAPRTFFNRSLSVRRSVSFGAAPLDDLKFVKSTFETTVNDVVLAACTQALRAYLADHGEHLSRPLVVSVPVSVRGKASDSAAANQVSNMFVRLPVHLDDPTEQLRAVNDDTSNAKAVHEVLSADIIGDVTEITPPAMFRFASRMYSSAGLADRLAPIHNLVVSNVPGPPVPLYVAGARLRGAYPFGPLIEGSALNITVLSNMGNLDIGVIACPDVAPDIDGLVAGIIEGIEVLRAAAESEVARSAPPTRRTSPPRRAARGDASR